MVKLLHVTGQLVHGEQATTVLQPSNVQLGLRQLVLGEFWKKTDQIVLAEHSLDVQTLRLRLTRPQLMLALRVIDELLHQEHPKPGKLIETSLLEDSLARRLPSLVVSLTGGRLLYAKTRDIITCQVPTYSALICCSLNPFRRRFWDSSWRVKSPFLKCSRIFTQIY